MIETKYSIGDTVWYARCNWTNEKATCPDCGGTGRITEAAFGECRRTLCTTPQN